MYLIETTLWFDKWLRKLRDKKAKARILMRLKQVELGNLGDVKSVGHRISELRINYGQGYRVYFTRKGNVIILLLHGGDKSTQSKDIEKARLRLKEIEAKDDKAS